MFRFPMPGMMQPNGYPQGRPLAAMFQGLMPEPGQMPPIGSMGAPVPRAAMFQQMQQQPRTLGGGFPRWGGASGGNAPKAPKMNPTKPLGLQGIQSMMPKAPPAPFTTRG
jgi:hypothetical protein